VKRLISEITPLINIQEGLLGGKIIRNYSRRMKKESKD